MRRIRHRRSTHGEGLQAEFAASLANSGLAPLTVRAYRHDIGLFLKWFAVKADGLRQYIFEFSFIEGGGHPLTQILVEQPVEYEERAFTQERGRGYTTKANGNAAGGYRATVFTRDGDTWKIRVMVVVF